jgi:predicted transcriptional regulator
MKLLLYSTKANKYERLVRDEHYGKPFYLCGAVTENFESLNGKIVAECDFECEHLYNTYDIYDDNVLHYFDTDTLKEKELIERSCVSNLELEKYFGKSNGYAIHIKNLHIFDEPKELSDYCRFDENGALIPITKAPQNMMYATQHLGEPMYVENHYIGLDDYFEDYIVISIQPQWMCLILNHIKDVEVRRVVLKEMLKND